MTSQLKVKSHQKITEKSKLYKCSTDSCPRTVTDCHSASGYSLLNTVLQYFDCKLILSGSHGGGTESFSTWEKIPE